eukprot:TRINITY_DN7998_c0_g1_i1.p1 TRINITY_DN7998_c0_g1~~TRINITY_DN7998_c0_g1_i1.p1  ORF type:complete len:469 (-),score=91.93 TRINITY_DN7998_c0_g1_i1:150-1376(-)
MSEFSTNNSQKQVERLMSPLVIEALSYLLEVGPTTDYKKSAFEDSSAKDITGRQESEIRREEAHMPPYFTAILRFLAASIGMLGQKAFQVVLDSGLFSKFCEHFLEHDQLLLSKENHWSNLLSIFYLSVWPTVGLDSATLNDRRYKMLMNAPIGKCVVRLATFPTTSIEAVGRICQILHGLYGCDPDCFRRQFDADDLELLIGAQKRLQNLCKEISMRFVWSILADRMNYLIPLLSNYVLSAREEIVREFYQKHLLDITPLNEQMITLVVDYFVEGYRIGQMVDVRQHGIGNAEYDRCWRAGEVVAVDDSHIEVRFVGCGDMKLSYRIPNFQIAPAFTYTGIPSPLVRVVGRRSFYPELDYKLILKEPCLGISSMEELDQAKQVYGPDPLTLINYLRYSNRHRLKKLL